MFIQCVCAVKRAVFRRSAAQSVIGALLASSAAGFMLAQLVLEPVRALLLAAMVFVPFERLAAANRTQRVFRPGWATDAISGFLNGLLLFLVLLGALAGIDAAARIVAPQLRTWVAAQPIAAQAIVAVALGDLGVYGVHRLQHTVPWLWRFHAVH